MALSAPVERKRTASDDLVLAPVAGAVRILGGALCVRDAAGNARPGTDAAGMRFAGVAEERETNNLGGSAGDLQVTLRRRGRFQIAAAGLAAGDEGKVLYVVDDDEGGLTSSHLVAIGPIVKVRSASLAEVELDPRDRLTRTPLCIPSVGAGKDAVLLASLTLGRPIWLQRVVAHAVDVTGVATVDLLVDGTSPASVLDDPLTLVDDTAVPGAVVTRALAAGSKLDLVGTTEVSTGAIAGLVVELTYQVL